MKKEDKTNILYNGINVLSLCDGMSCGQIALHELGIKINKYYASEIDKNAIKVTKDNFPNTIQIGDVTKITDNLLKSLPKIDLIIFGSPCRSISRASQGSKWGGKDNNNGLKGVSHLFFDCVKILKWIQKNNNSNVYFLSENVTSKKHQEDINIMSKEIGVEPIIINSEYFSAQDRDRNYWTNIHINDFPEKNNLVLKDILDDFVDEKYWYKDKTFEFYGEDHKMAALLNLFPKRYTQAEKVCSKYFKSYTLISCRGGHHQVKVYDSEKKMCRKLTPSEYRKLQTIPNWYKMDVADTHMYNMLGDGWTIEVIKHIFLGLLNTIK